MITLFIGDADQLAHSWLAIWGERALTSLVNLFTSFWPMLASFLPDFIELLQNCIEFTMNAQSEEAAAADRLDHSSIRCILLLVQTGGTVPLLTLDSPLVSLEVTCKYVLQPIA